MHIRELYGLWIDGMVEVRMGYNITLSKLNVAI